MIIVDQDEGNILISVEVNKRKYGFTIKDVDPKQRVWLDEVIEGIIKRAYKDGKYDAMKEVKRKVKDLKDFLS